MAAQIAQEAQRISIESRRMTDEETKTAIENQRANFETSFGGQAAEIFKTIVGAGMTIATRGR